MVFIPSEGWVLPGLPFVTDSVHYFYGRIPSSSLAHEGVGFGGLKIPALLFADGLWPSSKSETKVLTRQKVDCPLQVGEELSQMEEFSCTRTVEKWSSRLTDRSTALQMQKRSIL